MEKFVERTLLYDFYGELLTEHQQSIYEDVVLNDYSCTEVAAERGISRQGERLLAPGRRYVERNCFGGKDGAVPVIAPAKLGNEAGIIGAAAL